MSKTASKTANKTDNNDSSNNSSNDKANRVSPPHYLMWFRRDLRVHDNTALAALCEQANADNALVSAIFFLTPEQWQTHDMSLTQLDLIARTLPALAKALKSQLNITLTVQVCPNFSDCIDALLDICDNNAISTLMANHEYEGNEIDRDEQLTKQLAKNDIEFVRWHDQCILPPKTITTNDGDSMYQVFTPFYKKWRHTLEVSDIQMHEAVAISDSNHTELKLAKDHAKTLKEIKSLGTKTVKDYQKQLEINASNNHADMEAQLKHTRDAYLAGETAACQQLEAFVDADINNYDVSRDVPSLHATSQLSAYLTIGAISPRLCYLQANKAQEKLHGNDSDNNDINRWISELAWRDFYRHVLDYKPELIRHQAYKHETDIRGCIEFKSAAAR